MAKKPIAIPYLTPRYQNDVVKVLETEYRPISPDTLRPDNIGDEWLFDDQVRILNHIFEPIGMGDKGLPTWRYDTVIISDVKKSGKTGIGAGIPYAVARIYGGEFYFLANAKEQARDRAFNRLKTYFDWRARTKKAKIVTTDGTDIIEIESPYAVFQALPCAAGSQAGSFVRMSMWDELWAYNLDSAHRLWSEFSPIPQMHGQSMRLVVTYAGYYGESTLLYSLYEATVKPDQNDMPTGIRIKGLEDLPCYVSEDGKTFAYWNHTPNRPWHTEEFLESRRSDKSMRHHEYMRLWENRWVSGREEFISQTLIRQSEEEGRARGLVRAGVL